MRVAVIGAGPAGFFVAGELLKKLPGCAVHLFEKRAAPYGLVRFGVAPDHPLTRRVTKMFDQIADNPRFSYLGNVEIGKDVTLQAVQDSYHAVVVCTGAEKPKRPDLPGAQLRGVVDALDFSWWVNGGGGSFTADLLKDVDTAIVVGNGNVALDAARMLIRPASDWAETDISPDAKDALTEHRVKKVVVLGRRESKDASFTEAELEEVLNLSNCKIETNSPLPFALSIPESTDGNTVTFLFHTRPITILGDGCVEGVEVLDTHKQLSKTIEAKLVIFATGHRGVPLDGLLPDAESGIIPNDRGRVSGHSAIYVCGWIKRGAKGLIGHNRKDAIETVSCLMEDIEELNSRRIDECDWVAKLAEKGVRVVTWSDWVNPNHLG